MPQLNLYIHLANWYGCLRQRTFIHTSRWRLSTIKLRPTIICIFEGSYSTNETDAVPTEQLVCGWGWTSKGCRRQRDFLLRSSKEAVLHRQVRSVAIFPMWTSYSGSWNHHPLLQWVHLITIMCPLMTLQGRPLQLMQFKPKYLSFRSSSMSWKLAAAEKLAVLEAEDEEDQFLTLLPASQQPNA